MNSLLPVTEYFLPLKALMEGNPAVDLESFTLDVYVLVGQV